MATAEDDDNWKWFCNKLKSAIYSMSGEETWDRYTIFSDRHPGLMNSIPSVFAGCKHSICLRHLVDNFKTQVRIVLLWYLFEKSVCTFVCTVTVMY